MLFLRHSVLLSMRTSCALSLLLVLLTVPASVAQARLAYEASYVDGKDGVEGLEAAWAVTVSPDGEYVYAAGYNEDAIALFARNNGTGELSFVASYEPGAAVMDGPQYLTLSPDGKYMYVAAYTGRGITVCSRDESTGTLSFVEFIAHSSGSEDGLYFPARVQVSPDGKHVYVAGKNDSTVGLYLRDADTGQLTYGASYTDGVDGVDGLQTCMSVAVSPDGRYVYATGRDDYAVAVFVRDADTGTLTYVTCYKNGEGGVEGLRGARSVLVSPDGKYVYVAGFYDDAVVAFACNAATGELNYLTCYKNGEGGVEGLDGVYGLELSPDGEFLYASGHYSDTLVVFVRNTETGLLSSLEYFENGTDGIDDLNDPYHLAVSPDNSDVYVAARSSNSVVLFHIVLHTLKVRNDGAGTGTVSSSPSGIDCGNDCTSEFVEDNQVVLTATADTDSSFTGWSGAVSGSENSLTLTITSDTALTANFNKTDSSGNSPYDAPTTNRLGFCFFTLLMLAVGWVSLRKR